MSAAFALTRLSWRRQRWAVFAAVVVAVLYGYAGTLQSPGLVELVWRAGSFAEPWFVLPIGFGACWAAPLLAREQQHRTIELAYTQSVSRVGWLLIWVAPVAVLAVAATTGVYLALTVPDPGAHTAWGGAAVHLGVAGGVGQVLVAVALGLCAGAVLGRTVPAVATTVVGVLLAPYALRLLSVLSADPGADRLQWPVVATQYAAAAALLVATVWWMVRRVPDARGEHA